MAPSIPLLHLAIAFAFAFSVHCVVGRYTSIFNFGDSLSDTGNLYYTCSSPNPAHVCFLPYGETFFHRPTGRFSDGRVILDFIATSLGLPLVRPYRSVGLGGEGISAQDFGKGLNFAVGGATALDVSYFEERGIHNVPSHAVSLRIQLHWFNKTYSSVCASSPSSRCRDIFKNSLFMMGEIGGNDYNYFFFDNRNITELTSLVPLVVKQIGSVIMELIELGVDTIMVPGNLPIGCLPIYLQVYATSNRGQYDPQNGCLKWLNQFSKYHNEQLQQELKRIRALHPHVHLIYADYFNAVMHILNAPKNFGFTNLHQVCCVDENRSYYFPMPCGLPSTIVCDDPSKYVSWDGLHLTEAAYKLIATSLMQGSFMTPQFSILQQNSSTKLLQLQ
ncbi:GDSL esterase/lipase At1g28570-like [Cucurbita pepo subsp. pepo]|uniref:GDSL esterase/lipase At1g28570-like n=1 Tax=Cucurbita pepo subsp. pepo TaxID=3664 RepID=UPI000C9D7DBE|nr:GDSL esterase/lipase At1g28570-like [Cucurbita pepo subsp. pepo]